MLVAKPERRARTRHCPHPSPIAMLTVVVATGSALSSLSAGRPKQRGGDIPDTVSKLLPGCPRHRRSLLVAVPGVVLAGGLGSVFQVSFVAVLAGLTALVDLILDVAATAEFRSSVCATKPHRPRPIDNIPIDDVYYALWASHSLALQDLYVSEPGQHPPLEAPAADEQLIGRPALRRLKIFGTNYLYGVLLQPGLRRYTNSVTTLIIDGFGPPYGDQVALGLELAALCSATLEDLTVIFNSWRMNEGTKRMSGEGEALSFFTDQTIGQRCDAPGDPAGVPGRWFESYSVQVFLALSLPKLTE
uniref:Uncharacterized protein n=1 Tax=Mycena chlorophos TaxID=658473 RepID=A0ABQ0M504_MYCCL|nr:predicted protein [Mycena chlorophos]